MVTKLREAKEVWGRTLASRARKLTLQHRQIWINPRRKIFATCTKTIRADNRSGREADRADSRFPGCVAIGIPEFECWRDSRGAISENSSRALGPLTHRVFSMRKSFGCPTDAHQHPFWVIFESCWSSVGSWCHHALALCGSARNTPWELISGQLTDRSFFCEQGSFFWLKQEQQHYLPSYREGC